MDWRPIVFVYTRLCLREGMRWQCGEAPQCTTAHQMFETQGAQSTPLNVETTAPVPNLHSKSNHIQIPRHTNTLELYTLACDFEFCVFSFSKIFVSTRTHNIMAVSCPTICKAHPQSSIPVPVLKWAVWQQKKHIDLRFECFYTMTLDMSQSRLIIIMIINSSCVNTVH